MYCGAKVRKVGGGFQHSGTVVSVFSTLNNDIRIVVEFDPPVQGMLHIYRPDQVVVTENQKETPWDHSTSAEKPFGSD